MKEPKFKTEFGRQLYAAWLRRKRADRIARIIRRKESAQVKRCCKVATGGNDVATN